MNYGYCNTNCPIPAPVCETKSGPALCTNCPESGSPCIFPFTHKGLTYDTCVDSNGYPGETWCATEVSFFWMELKPSFYTTTRQVDSHGVRIGDKYGYCNANCPTPTPEPPPPGKSVFYHHCIRCLNSQDHHRESGLGWRCACPPCVRTSSWTRPRSP